MVSDAALTTSKAWESVLGNTFIDENTYKSWINFNKSDHYFCG